MGGDLAVRRGDRARSSAAVLGVLGGLAPLLPNLLVMASYTEDEDGGDYCGGLESIGTFIQGWFLAMALVVGVTAWAAYRSGRPRVLALVPLGLLLAYPEVGRIGLGPVIETSSCDEPVSVLVVLLSAAVLAGGGYALARGGPGPPTPPPAGPPDIEPWPPA